MMFKLGPPATSLQYLLMDAMAMKPLFRFIRNTCCFAASYVDLLLPDDRTLPQPLRASLRVPYLVSLYRYLLYTDIYHLS